MNKTMGYVSMLGVALLFSAGILVTAFSCWQVALGMYLFFIADQILSGIGIAVMQENIKTRFDELFELVKKAVKK